MSTWASSSLQPQSGSCPTGVRESHSYVSPKQLCQVWFWRVDTEPAWELRNSSAPVAQKAPLAALAPLETRASAANKLWHKAASSAIHSNGSFPGLPGFACCLVCFPSRRWKSTHMTPGEELKALSTMRAKHTQTKHTRSECVCCLGCFCWFTFPSPNLQQGVKQDVCETTEPKWHGDLHCFNSKIES